MKKKTEENFALRAYEDIEWSDFADNVPELTEKHWNRSETTPVVNERRILRVYKPFDESAGNDFFVLFEPALCFFNGWDEADDTDREK